MGVLGSLVNLGGAYQQQAAAKNFYKHRYRWQRQDLEKAGYNPMLPFLGKGSGAGSVPGLSAFKADPGEALSKHTSNALAWKRQETELSHIRSQEQLNTQLGRKARQDAMHSASQKTLTDVQTLMLILGVPAATNAASIETEFGPGKQKAEWMIQQIGKLIPGLFLGVGRRGKGEKGRGPNPPRYGRFPNTKPAPYVGPRRK